MTPRGIALSGPIASGKTTIREYLTDHYGFEGLAFATPVKRLAHIVCHAATLDDMISQVRDWCDEASHYFSVPYSDKNFSQGFFDGAIWASTKLYYGRDPFPWREFCQKIATDIFRALDPDIWLRWALSKIQPHKLVVVDDLRFPNELEALHEMGFICIRLDVSLKEQRRRIKMRDGEKAESLKANLLSHESENLLKGDEKQFHYRLSSSDIVDMRAKIDQILIDNCIIPA